MNELRQVVVTGSKMVTAFGIIAIVLGVLALIAPAAAGLSIAMLLGLLVTFVGILRMIWAFRADNRRSALFKFALGTLTLICGIALFANPVIGSGMMTMVLSVYFLLDGFSELAAGISTGSFWLVLGGSISILLAVLIWEQYPLSGAWAMGTLIGIKLFFVGLIMVKDSSAVRNLVTA